jgi:hypothetical protein
VIDHRELTAITQAIFEKHVREHPGMEVAEAVVVTIQPTAPYVTLHVHIDGDPPNHVTPVPLIFGTEIFIGSRVEVFYTPPCGALAFATTTGGSGSGSS